MKWREMFCFHQTILHCAAIYYWRGVAVNLRTQGSAPRCPIYSVLPLLTRIVRRAFVAVTARVLLDERLLLQEPCERVVGGIRGHTLQGRRQKAQGRRSTQRR